MTDLVIGKAAGRRGITSVALEAPDIFTVTGSPLTNNGTLTIGLANQTAHRFLAGPTSGAPAAPGFRAIEVGDLPAEALNVGTVTSVGLSVPSFLSASGSPITSAGTLTVTLASQSANLVFAGPTTGSAAPTFRSLVVGDIPTLDDTRLANAVILAPNVSTRNVIQPSAIAVTPLTIKGFTGSTAPLLELQDATGATRLLVTSSGRVGFDTATPATRVHATANDAVTNTVTPTFTIGHNTSGTPAAGFGTALQFFGQSVGGTDRTMGRVKTIWVDATELTKVAKTVISAYAVVSGVQTEEDALTLLATSTGQALIGLNQATPTTALHVSLDDTATSAVTNMLTIDHTSTGTPAAGFGSGIQFLGESTTTVQRGMGRIRTEWTTATDASRASKMVLSTFAVATETDAITILSDGKVGIGAAPTSFPLEVHAASSRVYINSTTNTNLSLVQFNNGGGSAFIGIERSTGGALATNTAAYSLVLASPNGSAYPIHFVASNAVRVTVLPTGELGVGTTSPSTKLHVALDDTATNAVTNMLTIDHTSTGTPAAGFGAAIQFLGESSTTVQRSMGRVRTEWNVATDAGRASTMILSVFDTAERDGLYIKTDTARANVAIGQVPPAGQGTPFTVYRSANATIALVISNDNGGTSAGASLSVTNGGNTMAFSMGGTAYTANGALRAGFATVYGDGGGVNFAAAAASGRMGFFTGGFADGNERVRIASDGKVGIGTTTMTSLLDVAGDVEIGSANAFFMGDPTTDGSWRITRSGNDLVMQRRESGSWVTKSTIAA